MAEFGARLLAFVAFFGCLATLASGNCVSCPPTDDDNYYYVHLLPHSHMDLGWVKTVEQYFRGTHGSTSTNSVHLIYDSVLAELAKDTAKRFIFVETGFFTLWWNSTNDASRALFGKLVHSGQIEFIGGGIVMNDEAAAHYENIIDQMSFGLKTLQDLFGECGRVETGWQIDPFGHSKQFALILRLMGFKQLIYGRVDDQERSFRKQNRNMEFKFDLGNEKNITVTLLPDFYTPAPNVCWDQSCGDAPVVLDENSAEFNAKSISDGFVQWVQNTGNYYRTNNLLIPMGGDFQYQLAHKWFINMDKLIQYVNNNDYKVKFNGVDRKVRVVYSTPTCYARASAKQQYSVNEADFFPYGSGAHNYWTGYFTSRPSFKYLVRWATGVYRSISQIISEKGVSDATTQLRHALAIAQHHDSISGTAKQFVNDNYAKLIFEGIDTAVNGLSKTYGVQATICQHLNASVCAPTENISKEALAVVYNPLVFDISTFVRVPVSTPHVEVLDEDGKAIAVAVTEIGPGVLNLAERQSNSKYELTIPLDIVALHSRQITIKPTSTHKGPVKPVRKENASNVVNAEGIQLGIGPNGIKWVKPAGSANVTLEQQFAYYESSCNDGANSGAYVFRPKDRKKPLTVTDQKIFSTDLFTEVHLNFTNGVFQSIRYYKSKPYIELDWVIGPIDVSDNVGKEFVTVFSSSIASKNEFYTDSNGRDSIKRTLNTRANWNFNNQEPESGNYYPINNRISINDSVSHLTVITDRSQGATSLNSGSIEVMLHRRCVCDDGYGVNEALNEPGFDGKGLQARGTLRVYLGDIPPAKEDLQMTPPLLYFVDKAPTLQESILSKSALGDKVHVLSFTQVSDRNIVLKIENIGTEPFKLNTYHLFTEFVYSIKYMDLAGLHSWGPAGNPLLQPKEIITLLVTLY